MSDKYIIRDGNVVPCDDLIEWATWFEDDANRRVALDEFDGVRVSTVFLGLDHAFGGTTPILWETMVFGGPLDQEQERYTSELEARAGHARWVEAAKERTERAP